jgi:hypothetical protein
MPNCQPTTLMFVCLLLFSFVSEGVVTADENDAPLDKPPVTKTREEKAEPDKPKAAAATDEAIRRGLAWLASQQAEDGSWSATGGHYPVAMTALAGTSLMCEGSTTAQGKYSANVRKAVDYLIGISQPDGLIGDPKGVRYTYGHGFSMLFLSQVLKQEKDVERRAKLTDVLAKAVAFTGKAQTTAGGWGYVSAKDGSDFDEGSTTVTQLQGLGGCRGAGVPVPKETIDRALEYLRKCTLDDGGLMYSLRSGGKSGRPPITAAAVACLDSVGNKDAKYRAKLLDYCKKHLTADDKAQGHWHYANLYFAQSLYRGGGKPWQDYRRQVCAKLEADAAKDGSWPQGFIGPVYTTAINLTILQLEKESVPIYRR